MTITYVGTAVNPADNVSLYDATERSITPVPSMLAGDLVRLIVQRRGLDSISLSNLGGQSWTSETLRQTGSASLRVFWCRFNGTWSANPSVVSTANPSDVITIQMDVFRPTSGTNTWAVDVVEARASYSAPVSPFDVTVTGQTALASSTVTMASWQSNDINTWGLQTAGWTNLGGAQYRNPDPAGSKKLTISSAYKIQSAPGATGSPVNRQLTFGPDAGQWVIETWKEQSAGVTVASAGDAVFHDAETGIVITGTSFGASHTGSADVIISPTNNIADAGAVVQTQTAWGNTSVTITAVLNTFAYFTNLFLFVRNSSGQANSSGFVIQREAIMNLTVNVKNLAGTLQPSITGIDYTIRAQNINGTLILSGNNAATDGSANMTLGPYTLTSGGPLSPNDDVWLTLAKNGASQALSFATCEKLTPTYT